MNACMHTAVCMYVCTFVSVRFVAGRVCESFACVCAHLWANNVWVCF